MVKCEDCKKKIEEKNSRKSEELVFFENYSNEEYCMKAVEQNGYSLRYVKEQSEAVCMKAVEQNGDSLQYVKERRCFNECILFVNKGK